MMLSCLKMTLLSLDMSTAIESNSGSRSPSATWLSSCLSCRVRRDYFILHCIQSHDKCCDSVDLYSQHRQCSRICFWLGSMRFIAVSFWHSHSVFIVVGCGLCVGFRRLHARVFCLCGGFGRGILVVCFWSQSSVTDNV